MATNQVLSALLDEREALAGTLADWRRRWDAVVLAERGSAEFSMSGLKPLDDRALELAHANHSAPSLDGGGIQPPLPSSGRASQ